jgi:hypothetical protein
VHCFSSVLCGLTITTFGLNQYQNDAYLLHICGSNLRID